MTTLYRPVLIETAEQAEALPEGSILHRPRGRWSSGLTGAVVRSPHHDETIFRVGVDRWPVRRVLDVFAEALVPIEAEEEVVVNTADLGLDPEAVYQHDDPDLIAAVRAAAKRTRLVTPWEVAE